MAGSRNLSRARNVTDLRYIQRKAAELAVARVSATIQALDENKNGSLNRLDFLQSSWAQNISGPFLDLHFAQAWSAAILQEEAELGRVESEIRQAETERTARGRELALASARAEAAQAFGKKAVKAHQRRREEAQLSDLADRLIVERAGR